MKPSLIALLAAAGVVCASPTLAQQPPPPAERAAAQALYAQIKAPCAGGSQKQACGVLAYAPEDCNGKEKDPHFRQVYNSYEGNMLRFQSGSQITKGRPVALLNVGIIGRDGKTTRYVDPQFISLEAYKAGTKSVTVCGHEHHIRQQEFDLPDPLEKFLKTNPQ